MSRLGGTMRDGDPRARRRALHQLIWLGHLLVYLLAVLMLSVVAGPIVGVVVALAWGIALASHGFVTVAAPPLLEVLERRAQRGLPPTPTSTSDSRSDRSDRSLETLAAAIAHEIRNPITAAKSLVQQIAEDPSAPSTAEYASVAVGELDRVERSIVHLLRFAREENLAIEPVDMGEVIRSAVDTIRERSTRLGIEVSMSLDRTPILHGDAEKLRRVVINLLSNSLDALEEASTSAPAVSVSTGSNLGGGEVWVSVRDNGPGISADVLPRIFDPFFTSKEKGTGFGLSLARKTIDAHGGTFEVRSVVGSGVELIFVLPRGMSSRAISTGTENDPERERSS